MTTQAKHTPETTRMAQDLAVEFGHHLISGISPAHLYATAPELLEALKQATQALRTFDGIDGHVTLGPDGTGMELQEAEAIIAKAEGRS